MEQETVLMTGANGYVGLHVTYQCLAKGWAVIGMVRSRGAEYRLQSIFPDAFSSSQLTISVVSDIIKPEQYEPAFQVEGKQVTAVINTASPLINEPQDVRTQVLDPAIQSSTALLEAVLRLGGGSVRRVVHTSSCGAVLNVSLGLAPGKTYTPEDWNPTTYEEAAEGGPGLAYVGSKAVAEKAMWAWMKENEPSTFDFFPSHQRA
jgi:nucleoside-diphosphate-sugar epimerase